MMEEDNENENENENIFDRNQLSSHFLMGKKDNENELSIASEYSKHNTHQSIGANNTQRHRNSQNFTSPTYGNQNNGFQSHENTAIVTPSIISENEINGNSNTNGILNSGEYEINDENQMRNNEEINTRFSNWEMTEKELRNEIFQLNERGEQIAITADC